MIFPILPSQRQGVEDLRLVRFTEDDGRQEIVGTYTAFDGRDARQELLHGIDFRTVKMRPLARPDGRLQGHGAVPTPNWWALCHAWPAGQREYLAARIRRPVSVGSTAGRSSARNFSGSSCSSAIAARQSRSTKAGWSSRTASLWYGLIASVPVCSTRTIPQSSWPVPDCRCSFRLPCRSAADMCQTWCIAAER